MKTLDIPIPQARSIPADLADVALIDAEACAAVGAMSVSWWHAEVAAGRAPAPAVRRPRCTRWHVAEVRAFWQRFADRTADAQAAASRMTAHLSKASAAALAKRKAARRTVTA